MQLPPVSPKNLASNSLHYFFVVWIFCLRLTTKTNQNQIIHKTPPGNDVSFVEKVEIAKEKNSCKNNAIDWKSFREEFCNYRQGYIGTIATIDYVMNNSGGLFSLQISLISKFWFHHCLRTKFNHTSLVSWTAT